MQEGIFINNEGDRLRGVHVFNGHVREADYGVATLRTKAAQVTATTRNYVADLSNDHPQEMQTMLQYSL